MNQIHDSVIMINGLRLDCVRGEIHHSNGDVVELSPRLFAILRCLMRYNGELVTYADIARDVWQDDINDSAIYQQMTLLRKALRDNPQSPECIKTVPRKGYQFIGNVQPVKVAWFWRDGLATVGKRTWTALPLLARGACTALCLIGVVAMSWLLMREPELNQQSTVPIGPVMPTGVVAIESFFDPNVPHGKTLNGLAYLIRTHLNLRSDIHVSPTPAVQTPDDEQFLTQHFQSAGEFTYLIQPNVVVAGERAVLTLHLKDLRHDHTTELLRLSTVNGDFSSKLAAIEQVVVSQLTDIELLGASDAFLSDNTDATRQYLQAANILQDRFNPPADIKQSIEFLQQHIIETPDNLAAYTMLWDGILILLDQHNTFDVNKALTLLDVTSQAALERFPNFFKAKNARAEYYCRVQEYQLCMDYASSSWQSNPYDYSVFGTLRFSYERAGKDSLALTRHNYLLNPFIMNSVLFYRNDLLKNGDMLSASELIRHHARWSFLQNNWYVQAQKNVSDKQLAGFSHWLRQKSKNDDSTEPFSRYLGYMLLNANRPNMARYWAENGIEENLPYFDLQVVNLWADLWGNEWHPKRWQKSYDYASQRREFQNALDKMYIAYFHLMDSNYVTAGQYIEEVFPGFLQDTIKVTPNNFRFLVYYNEVKKHIGDYRRVVSITHSLNQFAGQELTTEFIQNPYFGLSEAEFYALNGEQDRAIKVLQTALGAESWRPNAFWMWPPVSANRFFTSLNGDQRFALLTQSQQSKLHALCGDDGCDVPAPTLEPVVVENAS